MTVHTVKVISKERLFSKWTFLFVLLFAILYFLASHEGLLYIDDVHYSEFAARILNGTFDVTKNGHTQIHRLSVFVPVAIIYKLFGVSYVTYSIWPFICTVGCIVLTYRSAHQQGLNPAFAAVLLGLTFYFLYFSNFLYPDNIVALFALVSATLYFHIYNGNYTRHLFKGLVFSCSLFLAGLAKETAVIFLPAFAFFALKDLAKSDEKTVFWGYCLLFGTLLLVAYLGWYYVETGDALFRLNEMERANQAYDNYVTNPSREYIGRLLWGPISALLGTGTLIIAIFLVGGGEFLNQDSKRNKRYWTIIFLTAFITLCFSSTSLEVYNPIKLDARMYNLIIPPLAIAASFGLRNKLLNVHYTLAYTLAFAISALYLQNKVGFVYGLLSIYFAIHTTWLYFKTRASHLLIYTALAAIILAFAVRPVYFMVKPKLLYYQTHQNLAQFLRDRASADEPVQVFLPQYLYYARGYFLQYEEVVGMQIHKYEDVSPASSDTARLFLINRQLNTNPSFHDSSQQGLLLNTAEHGTLIWQEGPLELYQLQKSLDLQEDDI